MTKQMAAIHTALTDDEPRVRIDQQVFLTKDEAATALALVFANDTLVRTARISLQTGLNDAVRNRLLDNKDAVAAVPKQLVEGYRNSLDRHAEFFFRAQRPTDGQPVVRVEIGRLFTLQQAAEAMAFVYGDTPPARIGKATAQRALRKVTNEQLLEGPEAGAGIDRKLVDLYRNELLGLVDEWKEYWASRSR